MKPFPLRHLHLDFHTSEHIKGVGANFSPQAFAQTLKSAHVNSVNLFARCWHGHIYYDSPNFPERRHPQLTRNLLKEQLKACREAGITPIIYVAGQMDYYSSLHHPEWVAQTPEGCVSNGSGKGQGWFEPGFRRSLTLNSPFGDFLKAQVKELLELFEFDGFWFDGVSALDDSSKWTREQMLAKGLNPSDRDARLRFGREVADTFMAEMSALIRTRSPEKSIFYNEGHIDPSIRSSLASFTHLEVESLPGDVWGYDHFPLTGRFVRTLGKPWLGMTAKFHTGWADLHSYKTKAALEYECMQMLALGAGCSVGDQLHPRGEPIATTYNLIGSVYEQVAAKEAWCFGAKAISEIAVLLQPKPGEMLPQACLGALKILQAGAQQFDFVDGQADLSAYKLVVLPDEAVLGEALLAKLEAFLAGGGKLLASYRVGLVGENFALKYGVNFIGDAPYSPNFIRIKPGFETGLEPTEYVMYEGGLEVTLNEGEVLAETVRPYFNRSYRHFHSHRHAPSSGEVGGPAAVQNGNLVYFSHPIFSIYAESSPAWCEALVLSAIARLLPQPLVQHSGPSTLQIHATELRGDLVLHLLHYVPQRKGPKLEVIDDVIPLFDIELRVRASDASAVQLVPQEEPLAFTRDGGTILFRVPELRGHQTVHIGR